MQPTSFKEKNFVFTKPSSMTAEECGDLQVWKGDVAGYPYIVSCWKVTPEDLEEIQKSGVIWLSITGRGMPPVSVFTGNPFSENIYKL